MLKKITFLHFALILMLSLSMEAQSVWTKINANESLASKHEVLARKNIPNNYDLFSLNTSIFEEQLNNFSRNSKKIIELPAIHGNTAKFLVKETSNLAPELAAKFPTIKSYSAQGIDDPTATAKISVGSDGIHAIIFSGNHSTLYIDPYTKNKQQYISYKRSSLPSKKDDFTCTVEDASEKAFQKNTAARGANDGKLRTFRLAIVCSGEYAQFHLNRQGVSAGATDAVKKAAVLSAMNTSMTRINGVYERDLGVRMVIVADNDKIIFLDADTDNITDGSAGTMIGETQAICDAEIGDANYDIGHIFSTGGSGLAGLGVVCRSGSKGRGVTGIAQPINDPYDIDYVSHEIGHQFGANHTQSNSSCNRNNSTAVEPGSASTIMGYAGICRPNVQQNSDDHFHAVSIAEMWATIQSTANCATATDTGNNAPTANAGADFSIPKSTPFVLKGIGTDADNPNNLTYNWEQLDNQVATMPPLSTNTGGPMFRSLPSTSSPNRYMPALETVVLGSTSSEWEVVPSVAREMNFSFLVRDNHPGGGNSARDDMKVTVVNTTPFSVNTPSTSAPNSTINLTWNVGQTNQNPINCQRVNIRLSTDNGATFPTVLVANTNNDGNEDINIPAIANTSQAFIMVEAADNIFYNISSRFSISNLPDFSLQNITGDITVCNTATDTQNFELQYSAINGFSEEAVFSASNVPDGAVVNFSKNNIVNSDTVICSISNIGDVASGNYEIRINATTQSVTKSIILKLSIKDKVCSSSGDTSRISTTLVKFNTINNQSAKNGGYSDFKNISTTVQSGQRYQLEVKTNTYSSFSQPLTTISTAWIDWNQNCQFDADEAYDLGAATGFTDQITNNSPLNITVPNNAVPGNTILRISTRLSSYPSSCSSNFTGEVEDYTLVVENATASITDLPFNNFKLYPNPSEGVFNLKFEVINTKKVSLKLFDLRGRLVAKKQYKNTATYFSKQLTFEKVNAGLYMLQISNGNKKAIRKILIK
ncbi:zinc-dependent metalloprotease [Tenacibaculum maritimum]|uniref:zinc-dependent metalloprotease n=1 Tax=Tenacibaculum maritimum TaxID=107401 RepID=UPI003875F841